ncbi:hypothetical protein CARUB_v10001874mg [Capsella rubella]|uniref:UDP-glycosyltransferases domain-containing protein n=1 Tax=Capsella rubella TaxID=81985 RepID=R0FHL8_9BRAS|nr:hypothetical protein CARUB_v10001874mg [Capsella rubella]
MASLLVPRQPRISPSRLYHQLTTGFKSCDVIALRTCKEIEDTSKPLEEHWIHFLSKFPHGSLVFCALGSQIILEKDQFQELCLGMEMSGLPFLVAVKPPRGSSTGAWVQQPLILSHPSVGCFVNHCGPGAIWECLMSNCQMVLIPFLSDQVLFTRLMTEEFKVSVEVSREKTGWFSKESLRDAIKSVMDKDSDLGKLVRSNHTKLKEIIVSPGLLTGYVDNFVESLQEELI